MKVKDIMTDNVIDIEANRSIRDVARLMAQKGVGCLIVTSRGRPLGIITERDLVARVIAEGFPPNIPVSDVMTTPIFTVSPEQDVSVAAGLMVKYKVRRLPVVLNKKLVGIVTTTDLARTLVQEGKEAVIDAISRQADTAYGPYG